MKRRSDVVLDPVMLSPSMRELDRMVQAVAPKEVVVTLIGESGSGKEVFARRIHDLSTRRAQAKLLRFLENRRFMRVGGSTKVSVDVRMVCATLRPLEEDVRAGRFRADLYYRIEGITLHIPSLRERPADIAPLARQFIAELSAFHGVTPPKLGRSAMAALQSFGWPGNVRQLRNAMERICLVRPGLPVRLTDLPQATQGAPSAADGPSSKKGAVEVPLDQPLEKTIHQLLVAVLQAEKGNRARTARRLGVSLRTVQRHLARNPP